MKIMQSPPGMTRPPRENWSVGSEADRLVNFEQDKLVSTADLLQKTPQISEDGVKARYAFQRDCSRMKPATMKQYGLAMAKGAAWGAVGGAVCGVALNVAGSLFEVFTLGMLGRSQAIGLAIPAVVGSVLGTFIGASNLHAEHSDYPIYGESIGGTLKGEYGPDGQKHLRFYPQTWQAPSSKVDLEEFARAPVVGGGEPGTTDTQPQWWQAAYPHVEY